MSSVWILIQGDNSEDGNAEEIVGVFASKESGLIWCDCEGIDIDAPFGDNHRLAKYPIEERRDGVKE